ncbi:MAG: 3-hydroxyacyl-ACP dehydratase FabZ [Lawsonibacter sp.]|nr:3-hydroxyacyl-ACP dehydratase FabZ [Lawsonibacter sp.]
MELDIDQIEALLPHRYPFLLVDKITDCIPGQSARGIKCVTANEPFFQGHFPGFKVMPGVLIIEALAQVGAVAILTEEGSAGKLALFGGIKNARFKQQVRPGDVLELECELTARKGPVGFGTASAKVNGKTACKAELTFALTERPVSPCETKRSLV